MNEQLKNDMENLEVLLEKVRLQSIAYLNHIDNRKTSVSLTEQSKPSLNEQGIGALNTLDLFNQEFEHLMVAASGSRYLGYVIGGTTPASIMGDWLTSVYDQNPQTTTAQGDVSIVIEKQTVKLLLDLFDLPSDFLGGFVTGATMSNFTCLAVARQWVGKNQNKNFAKEGVTSPINILSATPHSSVLKSLSLLGIGSGNLVRVNTYQDRESMNIHDLEKKIKALGGEDFILISSAGTVNTTDFDNLKALSELRNKYNFWWHVDGAFGAFAACSPKFAHLTTGWEFADSITIDCHKWLNVPYESAVFLVKESHKKLQIETFKNYDAPYLGSDEGINFLNFLPENSRRLKALPAWFSLKSYGKEGYRDIIENSAKMASLLGDFIRTDGRFELLASVRLNNVCFSLKNRKDKTEVSSFLTTLNSSGKVYMTPTFFKNTHGIRASFVNWRTAPRDIEIIINEMRTSFDRLF